MLKTEQIVQLEKKYKREFSTLELISLRWEEGLRTNIKYNGEIFEVKPDSLGEYENSKTGKMESALPVYFPNGVPIMLLEGDFEILEQ